MKTSQTSFGKRLCIRMLLELLSEETKTADADMKEKKMKFDRPAKGSANRDSRLKRALISFLGVLFWIAVWWIAASVLNQEILLASPARVFRRLFQLALTETFWRDAGTSLVRIVVGYAAGVVFGAVLAVGSAFSRIFDSLSSPVNTVIKATPVASFIILALVWIKAERVPSFIAFLMVTPIVWSNLKSGFESADGDLREMTGMYGMSFGRRIKYFWVPSVAPYFVSALTTALGLSWKAGIAAEVLCNPKNSIGRHIYESKLYLETADLFAWTALVIILSVIIEKFVKFILERLCGSKWKS